MAQSVGNGGFCERWQQVLDWDGKASWVEMRGIDVSRFSTLGRRSACVRVSQVVVQGGIGVSSGGRESEAGKDR